MNLSLMLCLFMFIHICLVYPHKGTMMNFTEDAPVKKGSVLLTRMESITAYKNQRGQPKSATPEQSDIPVSANDMCSLAEWPSHARRNRARLQDEAGGQKKKGRGVLKGFKASKKRFANGSAKLNITFSEKLGGTVGMNYRSFKDDVVVIMKRKLPLIGVTTWSDIHPTIHRLIVADIIDRWDLEDTPETEEKVLKIAKERYRGWRSTLSSTYKAYKTDAARLANLPEDLQPEEWEWMIEYFGTDSKFQDQALEEVKNKEAETEGPLSSEQKNNVFQTAYKDTLECKSSQPRGYGYMAKTSTGSEKFRIQIEEQARATAATQERNSQLSQQVNDLEDQLQAERANTQERINLERAEREQLEERLKEERAERERLLQEERTSRLEFEKNMMAKFVELSKQMETQQTSSPNKTPGSRPTAISSNALIQAAARQSRMYKAMDPKN
ncbi:uncharacterized protein LOC119366421 [Triticum dicoccoides]|uniref:uncharacterized protein LOC119366421 n=1 Tax=Triticum dicoccoides TaxID=85692 RepID=UPI00188F9676|nr:uncharacterized protein LOC119366421 [Triticum dicoccoides]